MDLHTLFETNMSTSKGKDHFVTNIEQDSLQNKKFRKVLYTSEKLQVVVMSIPPGGEIGSETHDDVDQFIRVEGGTGKSVFGGKEFPLKDGSAIVIPRGTKHNVINTSDSEDLKLYTIYGEPTHMKSAVHDTQEDAKKDDEHFDGKTDIK
jgi:mannose-6-phosphate isomerase-like protein (cupin superfamily)